MNVQVWIRQSHRWVSLAFTLSVVLNFVVMAFGPPPQWITYAPLLPLALLFLSGSWLFVQPWLQRRPAQAR